MILFNKFFVSFNKAMIRTKMQGGCMAKVDIAIEFLKGAAHGNVKKVYEKHVAPHFIHHNQYFKGDRQSLMDAMIEAHKMNPNKTFEVKHFYEDGNSVITHSSVKRSDPNLPEIAVVHIFRFENDRIVELWDLGQEVSKDSPNENGPF
jgi:predicted SnoaL-like aldol condensation-catalyzing enzyme